MLSGDDTVILSIIVLQRKKKKNKRKYWILIVVYLKAVRTGEEMIKDPSYFIECFGKH